MKKNLLLIVGLTLMSAVMISSCSTGEKVEEPKDAYVKDIKFTSVDKLLLIQPGNTYDVVVQTLGCEPYNLLSNQKDGYAIYVYKYKLLQREIKAEDAEVLNQRGGETAGIEVYNPKIEDAYLVFKNNVLESIMTTQGRQESAQFVLMNNTLYKITKENGSYVIHAEMEMKEPEPKKADDKDGEGKGLSLPFMNKNK